MHKIPIKTYAKRLKKHQTRGELSLWFIRLLSFKPQAPVHGYVPDFYSNVLKVAIEVQGSVHAVKYVKRRDKQKRRNLRKHKIYTLYIADSRARKHKLICTVEIILTAIIWRSYVGLKRQVINLLP